MAWTTLLNALFLAGKPILGSTGMALRDNLIAALTGDTSAQRIYGQAAARRGNGLATLTISAANTYTLTEGLLDVVGTLSTTSGTDVVAETFTMTHYTGVVRAKASHNSSGGNTSFLSLYKNNVLVTSFTTTSAGAVARTVDVTFVAGDVIEWRHRCSATNSTVSAVSMTASDAYLQQPLLIPASAI